MKRQKILHLFNEANDSKFVTSKWNIVNYHSNADYNAANEITHNTHKFLKYNLCHYNDAYILLRRSITKIVFYLLNTSQKLMKQK